MIDYQELYVLPPDIQRDWLAQLHKAEETVNGVFRLVNIRRTGGNTFEGQRITVLVIDENGFPLPNIQIAFSYSTARPYIVGQDFLWSPPAPRLAFIVPTQGSGQVDQVQGDVVKAGQPGGVTVYCLEPECSSDYVSGCGMLADHTGLYLTFQLQRPGVTPIPSRLAVIEQRLSRLEDVAFFGGTNEA